MTDTRKQIRLRPVIRVFVSSTFSDMKHERNALQADVFPMLEQLCLRNGFQFQAIDLRWGVSTEAGLDHRTMRICFDELRRAQEISPRPNFLILLGNRYGWRPLPEEISVDEFQALERAASTAGEPAVAVLRKWYRQDENAVPPVCLLQSRLPHLPDWKGCTENAAWNEVQTVLWEIINRAMPPARLQGRFEEARSPSDPLPPIVRFQASATEQEIWQGALRVPDASEHVLAFFREIENVGGFPAATPIKDFVDLQPSGGIDTGLQVEQERLKTHLRGRLGLTNVFEARAAIRIAAATGQAPPVADVTTDHLGKLCSDVETRLTQIIQSQIDEYWQQTTPGSAERTVRELEIEQQEHARASQERGGAESFVGRKVELEAIRTYLCGDSPWPLVVHGASGCGKTALLSRAAQEAEVLKPVVRLIGIHPRSSDLRGLLSSLCQELRLRHPREGALPTEIKELSDEFHQHLQATTPEQPLIIFLDALDQLADADNGRQLHWLPVGSLPAHVKFVVSCLSDRATGDPAGQPYAELKRRQIPAGDFINLDVLSEAEARTLLFDRWLPQAGRTVSQDQRARIEQRLGSATCRQPIYLKLLFEEIRLWRSYDVVRALGEDLPALLGQYFERLRQPTNHGALLVDRVLGYLAASRHGLAENEILEVLFADHEFKAKLDDATKEMRHELPPNAKRIPIAIWSRLRFDLAAYLTEHAAPGANVLTFYHRQVGEWVRESFAKRFDQGWQPHPRLADYFTACAKGTDPQKEWETDNVRGFAECVFHLTKAKQHEQAAGHLTNFPFLLHKLRVGLLEGVFEDYDMVRREAPSEVVRRLEIWADFFREKGNILRRGNTEWPTHKIFLQLAVEHADDSPLTLGAERWLTEDRCGWLWLRRVPRLPHAQRNSCLAVLEGHTGSIYGAIELADGHLLSWSNDHTLRLWDTHRGTCLAVLEGHTGGIRGAIELADGRLLTLSFDHTLRLWETHNGACLAVLKGHAEVVVGALELSDRRLLSWSRDKTLRLWNETTGVCLAVLQGHTWDVEGALELRNGRLLSWSRDKTLRLWDELTGVCLAVLEDHTDEVNRALEFRDGRLLSWSKDKTLRIWDVQSEVCLAVLQGHTDSVNGALELRDGRILSWARDDKTLRLWNGQTGVCLAVLAGHTNGVRTAMELRDGRLLSAGGKTLRLWNGQTGACLAVLEGHAESVAGALELSDGRLLSWSWDKTLRLWDETTGVCLAVLEGHTHWVEGALELHDGRLLSWVGQLLSSEYTLRLWDWKTGARLAVLEGHTWDVEGALELHDGRLLSWADDGTLRLWDETTGVCLAVLEGHTDEVHGALELRDGRLLSRSKDKTLRLWDETTGVCLAVLEGHTHWVHGALELRDGRLLSWGFFVGLRAAAVGWADGSVSGHAGRTCRLRRGRAGVKQRPAVVVGR